MSKKIIFFISIFFCTTAFSNENYYLMLKNSKVNVRMGPGLDYPVKFIYKKKYLPVKIIDKKENFRKVIDHKKNSGWIHISQLKKVNSFKHPNKHNSNTNTYWILEHVRHFYNTLLTKNLLFFEAFMFSV